MRYVGVCPGLASWCLTLSRDLRDLYRSLYRSNKVFTDVRELAVVQYWYALCEWGCKFSVG